MKRRGQKSHPAPKRRRAQLAPVRRTRPGASPGTLTADPSAPKPVISVVAYDEGRYEEAKLADARELAAWIAKPGTLWVNVDGLGDAEAVRKIGELFELHPLALEDVLNVHQRAKSEPYEGHIFIVLRMAARDQERLETEQVSIFLGPRFVVTFQEEVAGDSFDPVRERLRKGAGRIRTAGADYLAYALIDAIVDHYFPVLERYGERLDDAEDLVIARPTPETLDMIHAVKRDLLALRKAFWPLREAVNALVRDPSPFVQDETRIFFRDILDHITQIIDIVETYREIASGLMDVYLSSLSNRMNEVMKLLTVISTIFIPLTFIAGVYGMNFDPDRSPWNMPELRWYWGYPLALLLMGGTALALVVYFQRKGWLGAPKEELVRPRHERAEPGATAAPREDIHPW